MHADHTTLQAGRQASGLENSPQAVSSNVLGDLVGGIPLDNPGKPRRCLLCEVK